MRSLSTIIAVFVDYLACHSGEHGSGSIGGSNSQLDPLAQNTRYKTSMCRDFSARGICPRGPTCTFAHTQEELDKYRLRSRKTGVRGRLPTQEKTTSSLTQSESDQLRQVQLMSKLKDERSAKSATECAISGGDTGTDITKFLYSVAPKSLSPGSNSEPVQMKVPTDSQGFPHGLGTVKFSPAEEGRRPHVNMPTTRLTFSRPALDVQEPSYVATLNQQASLHPNTVQAQAFIPTQSIPMASTGLLPVQVPVSSAQAVNGINSDTSSGNFYNHHHHHHYQHPAQYEPLLQQQFSPGGALSSLKASSRNLMSLPAAAGESPQLSRDYNQYQNQAAQSNRAMVDQSLPQQHHQHVDIMPASQMVSSYPLPNPHPSLPDETTPSEHACYAPVLVPVPVVVVDYCASPLQETPREDDTLQDLWLRKQEIIQHLRDDPTFLSWQDPSLYQADSHRAGFHGLDTVLSQNKQTREAMPKPVSDMFVATRSTQSLDKLAVAEDPRPGLSRKSDDLEKVPLDWMGVSKNHYLQSLSSSPAVNGSSAPTDLPLSWHTAFSSSGVSASNVHSYHNGSTNGNSISARSDYQYHMSQRTPAAQNNASSSELGTYSPTSSDLNHQRGMYNSLSCASNVVDIHSSQADSEFSSFPGDDGDDNTIPFEQTKVSKFGPISRLNKTKCEYNAPVQVTADLSRHTVLAASKAGGYGVEFGSTAAHQTLSHCANVTSQAKAVERLSGEPAVKPTALERRSIWEQSPSPSYKNIAQLKAGAAGAVSNNEKLAYQLQAVELEISMKTGRKPEPVSKMIQAAVGPSQPVTTGVDSKGLMDMMATGQVTDCLRVYPNDEEFVDVPLNRLGCVCCTH
ncbi:RING finger and ccch-type Zinc finger domains 1 [Plakobranchus ocellatus]|uniref:RING finger and ccch-type Zinc finger domains 1 n=1 Tax=Plakobranchus ocellatus TaxID=259542 RepID=A0AAV3Z726_9GAST|nr:RING finger and ccch-type Zinc finger domains 1 [Plakobranchus ocellatus]